MQQRRRCAVQAGSLAQAGPLLPPSPPPVLPALLPPRAWPQPRLLRRAWWPQLPLRASQLPPLQPVWRAPLLPPPVWRVPLPPPPQVSRQAKAVVHVVLSS